MVANSSTTSPESAPPEEAFGNVDLGAGTTKPRGGVRRLLKSTLRVIDLQYRIWLTQAKMTLQRMLLYAGLYIGAALLGLLAIIFLYIGVFKLLTDVAGLRPVWAYLIYGGFHLIVAVVMVTVGTSILSKDDKDDDDQPAKEEEGSHEPQKAA